MKALVAAAALILPTFASADGIFVSNAWVPLTPPNVRTHAAYFTLANEGDTPRNLVGIEADGYAMAHLHKSMDMDGVAMMHAVDQISLAPGQQVAFAQGGLHVMLMSSMAPRADGDEISLTLIFADGEEIPVTATVKRPNGAS